MKLTTKERTAILGGETPSLIRKDKPDIETGTEITLAYSKPRQYWDETTGSVFGAPRERSVWIVVTKLTRHRKGGWMVRYDVVDTRQPALMLASGGGYTTDPERAIDRAEAELSQKDRMRLSVEARARRAEERERDMEARRRQERAFKLKLKDALNELDPLGAQLLLADLERRLKQAKRDVPADRAA